jgi:hypothetical protein
MKNSLKPNLIIFTALVLCGFLISSASRQNNPTPIKAGLSRILITPSEPVRMSGYAARTDPFKGVHDDLYAAAIVFDNGSMKTCLVTSDVIGYSHEFIDETKKGITKATGIPEGNIILTAVHNHGGPTTRAYGDELTATEKAYIKTLQDKLVQVVNEASSGVQPVRIGVGKGTCKMNVNRRARHAEGGVWLGRNPAGVCDHEVGVVRIDDMTGKTIGLHVNWPCHATTGGQENYRITGDWPGAAARELEKTYGNAVVMVSAGASGDINPIYGPNDSFNDINAIGQVLAEEVRNVFQKVEMFELSDLGVLSHSIQAKGKKPSENRMPNVSLTPDGDREIRISSLKVGNILFCGISGELMNEIGLKVKEESPFKNTFILTHCNGSSGYLCTDKAYEEGGYEPMVSRTMPGTEKLIVDGFRKLNNGL